MPTGYISIDFGRYWWQNCSSMY